MLLTGRTAIVSGIGPGMGRDISLRLAREGADIVMGARRRGSLEAVAKEVEALGRRAVWLETDLTDKDAGKRLVDKAVAEFGRVDVLVNNAGIAPEKRRDILETTPASFDRIMDVNARGTFFLTQNVARRMAARTAGEDAVQPSIVFITSISAVTSSTSRAEYCLSKAALSMAAALFAHALAPFGISVFEVRPGIIATDMTAAVKEKYDKLIGEGLTPIPRWGAPEDIGKAVAAIAQGLLPFSTGEVINVDGGFHLRRL